MENDALSTNIRQEKDSLRLQSISQCRRALRVPPITTPLVSLSVPSCSTAQSPEIQATQMDVESVSSEDSFSMWEVPADTTRQRILDGATPVSFVLESEGRKRSEQFFSCIPTNRRRTWSLNKSRKLQGTLTQKVSQSKVLQRACLWNHTALVNDAVWEAAVKNFGSVCVGC